MAQDPAESVALALLRDDEAAACTSARSEEWGRSTPARALAIDRATRHHLRPPMTKITADTLVCDVIRTSPEAFAVFEGYGMCQSCRSDPPPKPLHEFATRHDVPIDALIAQLEAVAASSGPEPRA